MNYKTRTFVVTNWALNTAEVYEREKTQIRFIAFGEETCPTTLRLHHQVYLYFFNQKTTGVRSLKKIGDLFGGGAHVKPMRGSFQQNEAYCSKEGSFTKLGDEPKQGCRGDIDETAKMILDSELTSDEVCAINPAFHHQYGRTFDRLETIALRKKFRTEMTEGIWYWGATGVGKSHKVFHDYNPATHYVKDLETEWWDGYTGQEIVIFNEFRSQFKFSFLLSLMDKWPLDVKVRNKESVPFLAKKLLFTSCDKPQDAYSNIDSVRFQQFTRRCKIKEVVRLGDGGGRV